ncbi:MAG: gluconate 2-dehydrogenase subunit 3 family protein [Deltaproteobacteria bacterium]|nr:gluconate 2-dehydrogenase subunit 3 family protein [Deltaproteobacteria bacterium]
MSDPSFSPDTQRTLAAVLDEIIPASRDGALPGAGALGVGVYVEERLGTAAEAVTAGLAALEELAMGRGAAGFCAAAREDRLPLLNEVSESHPGLLGSLIFHGYGGYYQDPRVVEALGLEARPPHPKGYELESGDLGLLDAVRARPKLYRDA